MNSQRLIKVKNLEITEQEIQGETFIFLTIFPVDDTMDQQTLFQVY